MDLPVLMYSLLAVLYLTVIQFDEDDLTKYAFQIIEAFLEGAAIGAVGLWEGFWGAVASWIEMDNAFWITLVLIAMISVYIIVRRFT